ncbi:tryptophan synthase subunit beta [Roseicyclus sp. F158]|uniref:tryptophan synthase n=1 Tax=Tropicimonas omnivorans TaxID=3075590 RepID=A0ABU3DFB6_9RHOB|nr:tryptophan synthase subunit beta [Roseicyclus sp. F158]MDT0682406.1 tryptophan synthase subunit beta [Roseicyclus sp. F158]
MSEHPAHRAIDGRYGSFGGQFVAPVLLPVLDRLESAFAQAWAAPDFRRDLEALLHRYVGRPTPIFEIPAFSREKGGARIFLKRDDLTFNGGNYANSAVGQCLLAQRMGMSAVVCDTGSGQNGVATAAVAARLGLRAIITIGAGDAARHAMAVKKMRLFGAQVDIVADADSHLSAATSAAIRHWMGNSDTTAYVAGAPIGPHPFPDLVARFQAVIGRETRLQLIEESLAPAACVSAVGGGASTIGLFSAFLADPQVRLIAVEGAGSGRAGEGHSARLSRGRRGIFHGAETLVLADAQGQIEHAASISPGLSYPGAAPQLANLVQAGRIETTTATDAEARGAISRLAEVEGILLCLEAGHALAAAERIAATLTPDETVVVMAQSSGDKDIEILAAGDIA